MDCWEASDSVDSRFRGNDEWDRGGDGWDDANDDGAIGSDVPEPPLHPRYRPAPEGRISSAYQTGTGSTQIFELFCIKFIAIIHT